MTEARIATAALRMMLLATTLLALAGCASGDSGGGSSAIGAGDRIPASDADTGDAAMSHVHGIGRNPADGAVYVATHQGLWRVVEDEEPELVGAYRHDFMGFAVVGPDHFVASGHPNAADGLPSHLGLVESRDAGKTWRSRSLLGDADFHALRVVGDTTYGWNSTDGSLMSSEDRRDWETLADEVMVLDIAVEPGSGETILTSDVKDQSTLELQRSDDAGRSFTRVKDAPPIARFAWPDEKRVWGFAVDGEVWASDDAGESWERVASLDTLPDAVAADGGELLVAMQGKILSSSDGGRRWTELARYA